MKKSVRTRIRKASLLAAAVCLLLGICASAVPARAAAKKKMYVVNKITSLSVMDDGTAAGDGSYRYTYTKNGLVRKCITGLGTYRYTYKNGRLSKLTDTPKKGYDSLDSSVAKYTYDKKGRLAKMVETTTSSTNQKKTWVYTYYYDSKDRVKKVQIQADASEGSYTYQYNSAGRIKLMTLSSEDGVAMTTRYTYNKNGDVKKQVLRYSMEGQEMVTTTTFRYTYKDGLLTKRVEKTTHSDPTYQGVTDTYTFTYKKISVPKSYVSLVQKQQADVVEQNVLN